MMSRGRCWLVTGLLALSGVMIVGAQEAPVVVKKAEAVPRVFYTAPGQFEVIVTEVADAQQLLALGRSVWGALSVPLGLPAEGFSSPVSVRLVPAKDWNVPAIFTVTVEPAGLVNVRVCWSPEVDPVVVRRALVQGVILRQAVAWHAVGPQLTVPLWLEHACTEWSIVKEQPAMLDSFQQEAIGLDAPPLRALLQWERGTVESRGWELASLWLFMQLQAEQGPLSQWGGWVRGMVGGVAPYDSLPRSYAGLWTDAMSLELWWHTAFQYQRRMRALPVMTAEASREWMQDRSRWLAGRGGREVALGLDELLGLRKEAWVNTELKVRLGQTRVILGVIHPYYANAALSMGKLYESALKGDAKIFEAALTEFKRDAIDGRELEDTVGAILDTAPRK
jgi:hypothetical protein